MYLLKSLGIRHVHALTHQRNHFPTRSYCQTQSWGINFPWRGQDQTFTGCLAVAKYSLETWLCTWCWCWCCCWCWWRWWCWCWWCIDVCRCNYIEVIIKTVSRDRWWLSTMAAAGPHYRYCISIQLRTEDTPPPPPHQYCSLIIASF